MVSESWWEEPAGEVYPLINRWKEKKFGKILDLGCGIGRHSVLFAQNGFDVSALDLGQEGLEKLEGLAKKLKLAVDVKQADMIKLPYKDESFDAVLAYHAIYHQDDEGIKKVIGEISRVLVGGGEAYITFISKSTQSFTSGQGKKVSENTIIKGEGHEAGIPHYYTDKEGIRELLKDFKIVEFMYKEEYYDNYLSAHYFVLVQK